MTTFVIYGWKIANEVLLNSYLQMKIMNNWQWLTKLEKITCEELLLFQTSILLQVAQK